MKASRASSFCDRVPRKNEQLLRDARFDDHELGCLDVSRLFFSTFATPDTHNWVRAIEFSEYVFDHKQGAVLATLLMKLIQAIRSSRTSVFVFSNPDCPGCSRILTEHERRLILAIASARRRRQERARIEMMMLCEGNDTGAVMLWLNELCLALPKPCPARNL